MPELPEVEVICQGLQRHLPGQKIEAIYHSGKMLRRPVALEAMRELLIGATIADITRRAKYLLIHMDSRAVLIIHLGMTGRLGIFQAEAPVAGHDHLRWRFKSGLELRFNDTRRFGFAMVLSAREAGEREQTFFRTTGPEPFAQNCTPSYLHDRAQLRRQAVKAYLMDAQIIAGIGNIYANEALFQARIRPARQVSDLDVHDWQRLLSDLRTTLTNAIACGGSTINDYVNASGEKGYFQIHFQVYGRDNQPCPRCETPIKKERISGRASFFCPKCQR
jgi:formamidopyrimidine-DNA glycosylase